MYIWKMAHNLQSNYNYTTKIRQLCSGVIFVHIVLISCNFVGYFVRKMGICMPDGNMTTPTHPDLHEGLKSSYSLN